MNKFPDFDNLSKSELKERYKDACMLLDGCYDVIMIWKAEAPSQIEWKRKWLESAWRHGASCDI